jgi:hypothetical protein
VFASLGAADGAGGAADARRFHHAPDVALLRDQGGPFLQLSVGSGGREPRRAGSGTAPRVRDYFFGLRDYAVGPREDAAYGRGGWNGARVLTSRSAFVDATTDPAPTVPAGAPGWRIALAAGETVLAEARTFGGEVFFTTFTPPAAAAGRACAAGAGRNLLYVVSAHNGGRPGNRPSKQMQLPANQLAGDVVFAFPSPDDPASPDGNAPFACTAGRAACRPDPVCLVGLTPCGALPALGPVRTTWSQPGLGD